MGARVRRRWGTLGLLLAVVVGCSGPETPAGVTLTADFWPTETYSSEAGSTKKIVLSSFESGALSEETAASFLEEFRGEDFSARRHAPRSGCRVRT